MTRRGLSAFLRLTVALILGLVITRDAASAPLAYHVTDLGAGAATIYYSAGVAWVAPADGSTSYKFSYFPNFTSAVAFRNSEPPMSSIPMPAIDPVATAPSVAFSFFESPLYAGNGYFVATAYYGIRDQWQGSTVYAWHVQPDGTIGPQIPLWSVPDRPYTPPHGPDTQVLAANPSGLLLGETTDPNSGSTDFILFDLKTMQRTDVSSLPLPDAQIKSVLGLDGEGQLLVTGTPTGSTQVRSYILSPPGILPEPVPEPSTLATLVFGFGGLLAVRLRRTAIAVP